MNTLEQIHATRAEQRKQRLIEAERELAAEEAEALHMTEEQRRILMQPFATVKAEFADLDGLRWTQAALRKLQPRATNHVAPLSKPNTYVVLTNADLATFSSEDTIRMPSSSGQCRPSLPSPLSVPKQTLPPPDPALRHRDGSRSRSPIKGLFPSRPESTEGDSIRAPSSLRFSVTDPVLSSNAPRSPQFSRQPTSSLQTPAPPGLPQMTGPPSYSSPTSDPSMPTAMSVFPPTPHHISPTAKTGRVLKRQKTMDDIVPLFQQGTSASPPLTSFASASASTLSILSPPNTASRISNTSATVINSGIPHKSARARLHSLLHDDTRLSAPSSSTTATPSPPPRSYPINTSLVPSSSHTPPDSIPVPSIDTSKDYSYDDDETPTPSPVLDYDDHPLTSSDTPPWIRS